MAPISEQGTVVLLSPPVQGKVLSSCHIYVWLWVHRNLQMVRASRSSPQTSRCPANPRGAETEPHRVGCFGTNQPIAQAMRALRYEWSVRKGEAREAVGTQERTDGLCPSQEVHGGGGGE